MRTILITNIFRSNTRHWITSHILLCLYFIQYTLAATLLSKDKMIHVCEIHIGFVFKLSAKYILSINTFLR